MITCNLVSIRDAPSLHTSAQVAKNGRSASRWPILALFDVLQPLCALPTPFNSFNVTYRPQGDNSELGLHWGCN